VKLALPDAAGPCDEPVSYTWRKGLTVSVPRSWRRNQDTDYHFSWYDRVIATGADIRLYISHGAAARHPLIGEGYAPVDTLEALHVDGLPATHYRKRVTGSDKVEATYDYYVLDTRMRTEREGRTSDNAYLYFQFSTRPSSVAEPDVEMQRAVLATVRLDDTWVSETPVERAPRAAAAPVSGRDRSGAGIGTPVASDAETPVPAPSAETTPAAQVVDEVSAGPDSSSPVIAVEERRDTADAAQQPAAESAPVSANRETASAKPVLADYEQAKRLREEGALLQGQGRLGEAVDKYHDSLALYPDDRLEAHVRRIEKMLEELGGK
jgi:hypothetical protein